MYVAFLKQQANEFIAVTWDRVKEALLKDKKTLLLKDIVKNGFPPSKGDIPTPLGIYWDVKDLLNVHKDVILYMDRIIVPQPRQPLQCALRCLWYACTVWNFCRRGV